MKKSLSISFLAILSLFLFACSTQNSLDGKYYEVYDGEKELVLEINGEGGYYYSSSNTVPVTNVDKENKKITADAGWMKVVFSYEIGENGVLELAEPNSSSEIYYKEGSQALEQALKESKE